MFLRTVAVTSAVLACAICGFGQEAKAHEDSLRVEETASCKRV